MEACPPCLQEVLGQLRKETAKVGKGGDEMVFAYVTALTAGLINRSCYDEEAWKEVGQELLVYCAGLAKLLRLLCPGYLPWQRLHPARQFPLVSSLRRSHVCSALPTSQAY